MAQRRIARKSARSASERVPRYLQVASALSRRIREGRWPVGGRIATIVALQREFRVARVTVRQAIALLAREGLVRARQGKGTFVIKEVATERWLRLATDWESLIAPIRDNVPHALGTRRPPPPRLGADDGAPAPAYVYLRSLQTRGREPYALASVHIARSVYRRAPKRFASRPALAVLARMHGHALARARQTLSVGAADLETARRLRLPLNAPTVEAHCVVVDRAGIAIYVGEIIYRGDVVHLDIELIGTPRRRARRPRSR
ncbi:MAG: GntR family transcriptional regulator [Burkholderiales bacterium]|nr:GntR family transcriptional regulator [Burkholderiales bacterium]